MHVPLSVSLVRGVAKKVASRACPGTEQNRQISSIPPFWPILIVYVAFVAFGKLLL